MKKNTTISKTKKIIVLSIIIFFSVNNLLLADNIVKNNNNSAYISFPKLIFGMPDIEYEKANCKNIIHKTDFLDTVILKNDELFNNKSVTFNSLIDRIQEGLYLKISSKKISFSISPVIMIPILTRQKFMVKKVSISLLETTGFGLKLGLYF